MHALSPGLRADLDDNARHLLGPQATAGERRALAHGVLYSFARFAIEMVTGSTRDVAASRLLERARGREHWERAHAAGRGIVAVSLHMGNYEVAPLLLSRVQRPVAIVFQRDPIGLFERSRSRLRRRHRVIEIAADRSPLFGIEILNVLRRKGIALIAGDLGLETREGEAQPFLGGRARFQPLAARIAMASGAPVLPCFTPRNERGDLELVIEPPIFPAEAGSREEIQRRLVATFADVVRRYPDQWLIIHKYWEGTVENLPQTQ